MTLIDVKIPGIGGFQNVPVIDIAVKVGDAIQPGQTLITLESDKATLDVPSPAAGTLRELCVAVGDKVSEGHLIARLEVVEVPAVATAAAPDVAAAVAPSIAVPSGLTFDLKTEMLVLGGGPGGYSAAFRCADLGLETLIVERYPTLGGVCLNVGCIPSKALLHVASGIVDAQHLAVAGVRFAPPQIDLVALRAYKDKVIGKLTGGLAQMAKARKVQLLRGYGHFLDAHHLEVELTHGTGQEKTGEKKIVRFAKCIIAAGSSAVRLPFLPDDTRILDSTGALTLPGVPGKMLIIGGGIIGLEMATVYSALGARLEVVEMLDGLMPGADREAVKVWQKLNAQRFDRILLQTKVTACEARDDGLWVRFAGPQVPAEPQRYDLILQAAGRSPNGRKIGVERAGITLDERGFIPVDRAMRTQVPHIYAIGDIGGPPMLAHKAVHEAHVAAEAAAGHKAAFDATVIPAVAYTHPEIAWVGLTEEEAKRRGWAVKVARFPWGASGRAISLGQEAGFTKLLFDETTGRLVGGAIVGAAAGDMIGELALAIEMGCDAEDLGSTIHPHPTLGETMGLAAEAALGRCTDLPPSRRG